MSSGKNVVPWDGVYRLQNVAYFKQNIGLRDHDIVVVGRHEGSVDPRIQWDIKATSVGEYNKITIKLDSMYIGVHSGKVACDATPYEWNLSYREVGRWIIRDPKSNLLLYLPNEDDGTEVELREDVGGEMSYWRFLPIRPSSN